MPFRVNAGDPTADEAAAIAAVLSSLDMTPSPSDATSPPAPTAWRRAALLEGTGRSASLGERS